MIEKLVYLDAVDPLEFCGQRNSKLDMLRGRFPKLNITCRANWLKAAGEAELIADFEGKVEQMLRYYDEHNTLPEEVVAGICDGALGVVLPRETEAVAFTTDGHPIKPRSQNQQLMVKAAAECDMVFAVGPAGTGKTYLAIALAVKALKNRTVKRILLSRPAVEAGEKLGFLPGDMREKIDPYLQPLYDALQDMLPQAKLKEYMESGIIQIAPLAFMRGRTLANAFVILDEAQNTTVAQMKMFLTRMGPNAKFIITGDVTQIDLPHGERSGLLHATDILDSVEGIKVVRFGQKDIVRHKLVQRIVDAFAEAKENAAASV